MNESEPEAIPPKVEKKYGIKRTLATRMVAERRKINTAWVFNTYSSKLGLKAREVDQSFASNYAQFVSKLIKKYPKHRNYIDQFVRGID